MLEQILTIKTTREKTAQSKKNAAAQTLLDSEGQLESDKAALTDYIDWRLTEERRRYDEITGMKISEKQLREIQQDINTLRNKDAQLQEQVELSKKALKEAQDALAMAEEQLKQAQKAVEKYQELCRHEEESLQQIAAQQEESELEEFVSKLPSF